MILSPDDLNELIVGKLITFNSFLSASSSQEVAMMFAGNTLLQIEVNNRTGLHAVFHPISDLSNFKHEDEVLFSIGNIFRIEKIEWCEKKSLWDVKLVLQKDLQHRSNFVGQTTNHVKEGFINRSLKYVWQNLIKSFVGNSDVLINIQPMSSHAKETI